MISSFAENKAPVWAKGAFVYRISTPDEKNAIDNVESGIKITSNLLDGSVKQIFFLNGVIGHDHPGICNWDGVWPYWNRVLTVLVTVGNIYQNLWYGHGRSIMGMHLFT